MTNSVSDRLRELAKQADPALADPRYTNKKRTEDAALLRAVADLVEACYPHLEYHPYPENDCRICSALRRAQEIAND